MNMIHVSGLYIAIKITNSNNSSWYKTIEHHSTKIKSSSLKMSGGDLFILLLSKHDSYGIDL